jgi:site-specific DNA-methyltransferase (adenine-specific)
MIVKRLRGPDPLYASDVARVVLDPFCGSGSTLAAAVAEGRRCVGIDVDPRFVRIAVDRVRD